MTTITPIRYQPDRGEYLPGMEYDLHLPPPDRPQSRFWRILARFCPTWDAVAKASIRASCGALALFLAQFLPGIAGKSTNFAGNIFIMFALWGLITPAEAVFIEHVQELARRIWRKGEK